MEKDFSKGVKPELIKTEAPIKREPFFGNKEAETYAVTIDTKEKLDWNTNEIEGDHIIAILTEQVSDEYLYYLQRKSISYIFTGETNVDLRLVMEQLAEIFAIEKIMLEGGGYLNGSFLNDGLIDEISLLLLPIAEGTPKSSTVFEVSPHLHKNPPIQLQLIKIGQLGNDVLWLRYKIDTN